MANILPRIAGSRVAIRYGDVAILACSLAIFINGRSPKNTSYAGGNHHRGIAD